MVNVFVEMLGTKNSPISLNMIGFIISIPVFCDAAFILLSSVIKEVSKKTGYKLIILSICLATGLFSAHVFVPPTPGPIAAAEIIDAPIGLLLIVGLFTGIIVSIIGYLWTRISLKKYYNIPIIKSEEKSLDVSIKKFKKRISQSIKLIKAEKLSDKHLTAKKLNEIWEHAKDLLSKNDI